MGCDIWLITYAAGIFNWMVYQEPVCAIPAIIPIIYAEDDPSDNLGIHTTKVMNYLCIPPF